MRILTHRKTRGSKNVTRHERNAERVRTHITRGDTVRVMRGDDKGKEGKIIRVHLKTGRVTIEGINLVKKHRRARRAEETSGIIEMPAPVALSNVMLLDPKSGEPTRIRIREERDPKRENKRTFERLAAKSGQAIKYAR
jgi:large subunit ribosomal protein L24